MSNMREKIILVDDIKSNLDQGRSILDPFYQVYPAASAEKMFKYLEKFIPDLILLDIEMPEMNGYEALKMLKADKNYAGIPVIFLTAKSDEESEHKGFELGAADYMSKPFSAPLLLKRIENQLLIVRQTKELKEALIKAENASLAKGNFLSNMSHEIRTPMNAIIGMTQIAAKSDDINKLKYCLSMIDNSSAHLLGIINNILDMSKIEADRLELENIPFSIETMLTKINNLIMEKIVVKNIKFNVILSQNLGGYYIGDELRLSQVIVNLLSNAVKFTPEGGAVDIMIDEIDKKDNYSFLRFTVKDTGMGMTEEQRNKLFNAFVQAESSTSREFGGTGLGLTISKSIVEKMDGRIWVESEFGKGSSFIFEIKLEQTTNEITTDPGAVLKHTEETPDFSGITLLLAEDIEINREIFISLLAETQVKIDTAENGLIAVEKFKQNPEQYDVIIMDVQMPEMDGYSAARNIRSLDIERAKTIPIIAMTANVFKEDIDRCLEAGMNDHLAKPIVVDTVIDKIRHYCHLGE